VTSFPKLSRPPILEALLDVRVKARHDVAAADFEPLKTSFRDTFPAVEEMKSFRATIEFVPGADAKAKTSTSPERGFLFRSKDGKLVAQCRVDGFTLSRLEPYTSFDDLYPMFIDGWSAYREYVRPLSAVRLALRYINRFRIPPEGLLQDYLTRSGFKTGGA
jgi:uncharacterized protein (TIGR04255 family)